MRNWRENMRKGLGSRPDYWLMLKKSESLPILGSVLNTHLSKCCQKSHHTHMHAYIDSTQPYPYCRQPASYMLHISIIASYIDQCKLSKGCTLSCKGLASTALIFSFSSICEAILPSLSMLPPEPRLLVSSASDYHHCPAGREKQSQTQVLMTLKYSSLSEFSLFFFFPLNMLHLPSSKQLLSPWEDVRWPKWATTPNYLWGDTNGLGII